MSLNPFSPSFNNPIRLAIQSLASAVPATTPDPKNSQVSPAILYNISVTIGLLLYDIGLPNMSVPYVSVAPFSLAQSSNVGGVMVPLRPDASHSLNKFAIAGARLPGSYPTVLRLGSKKSGFTPSGYGCPVMSNISARLISTLPSKPSSANISNAASR